MPGTPAGDGGLQVALQRNSAYCLVCPQLLLQVWKEGREGGREEEEEEEEEDEVTFLSSP